MSKNDYSDYLENIRQTLLRVMNQRQRGQREIARRCNPHRNEISSILSGEKRDARLSTIVNIADGLGLPLSALIGANESPDSESSTLILKLHAVLSKHDKGINGNYKHPTKSGKITIPEHGGDLNPDTVKSIMKQARL